MQATLQMSYIPTGDGGVIFKVGFFGSDDYIVSIPLNRDGAVEMAAKILAHSGVTEAEFSNGHMQARS